MYSSQNVAKIIKQTAKEKNVTIGKMLSECGLSKNALATMQSGGRLPHTENLLKIADYLDLSLDYLMGRDIKNNAPDDTVRSVIIGKIKTMPDDQLKKLLALLETLFGEE